MTSRIDATTGAVKRRPNQNNSTKHTKGMINSFAICKAGGRMEHRAESATSLLAVVCAACCAMCMVLVQEVQAAALGMARQD